jgi:transcriptional regulator with XRE-family HTH domain
MTQNIRFQDWEAEQMADPEFRAIAEEMEPAYQLARLRILHGLTQQQLAELVGTKQPSIARLESGTVEPRISFLRKVAAALDSRVEIRIVPIQESEDRETAHP